MLKNIFSQFKTTGTFQSATPFGSGHINDTYLVKTAEPNESDYILRRINHHIFTTPHALMNNVVLVTQHIHNKSKQPDKALNVILNHQQQPIVNDSEGNYWTCYVYIENSYSHDVVKNSKQAYEGGKLIGRFLEMLSDLPAEHLNETIPNFHNLEFRLQNFEKALHENLFNRALLCQNEIDFIRTQAEEMNLVLSLTKQGKIPLRAVHNDTKFNNLLLDKNDSGICVIDLDTVMPGCVHYDFSDAARTIANSSTEDEKDLTKISFDMKLFTAFCNGFLHECKNLLTHEEINTLAHAVPLMPFIHGTRFLTDYLSGDHYYKIHFPEHNLQRARAQFQLVRCMQEKMTEMNNIIQQIISQPLPIAQDY